MRPEEIVEQKQKTLDAPIFKQESKKFIKIKVDDKWIPEKNKRTSTIVSLFNKTNNEIVCPHFWELKPWTGCPFSCSYCYLQGTFWGSKGKKPRLKDLEFTARVLEDFLSWADSLGVRFLLNTGEVADSLAVPLYVEKFLEKTMPILERHPNHKILFLTKGGTHHIKVLEKIPEKARSNFIVSFSINPPVIAEKYEKGAAPPKDRISAAALAQEMGFEVRIRIDPMMPEEGWVLHYCVLIEDLLEKVNPSRITLGSLRGLRKTIKFASDRSWTKFFRGGEKTSWGQKIERKLRTKMYELVISALREKGYTRPIALCKETRNVWAELAEKGLLEDPGTPGVWENVKCNCKL